MVAWTVEQNSGRALMADEVRREAGEGGKPAVSDGYWDAGHNPRVITDN